MTVAIRTAHLKIPGGRAYQEDYCTFSQGGDSGSELLAVLADGMGGQGASGSGATASEIACKTFVESYRDAQGSVVERLGAALERSNNSVAKKKKEAPELGDMGTTLIGAAIRDNGLQWVSVGDSHLYLYRNGELRKLNEDHSFVPMLDRLVERGEMTREEALSHPNRNAIRSAVMGAEIELRDLPETSLTLRDGDIIILASDGLDTLDGNTIVNIVHESAGEDPEIIARDLMEAVEAAGKPDQDNTTIMVISVSAGDGRLSALPPSSKLAIAALAVLLLIGAAGAAAYFAGVPIPGLNVERAAPAQPETGAPPAAKVIPQKVTPATPAKAPEQPPKAAKPQPTPIPARRDATINQRQPGQPPAPAAGSQQPAQSGTPAAPQQPRAQQPAPPPGVQGQGPQTPGVQGQGFQGQAPQGQAGGGQPQGLQGQPGTSSGSAPRQGLPPQHF
ncbi:MAG: hypothetical protein D6773_19225, partial [Alphaproteobacteria bacterium]